MTRVRRWWRQFWGDPVRAEGLAVVRIATALVLLSDQLGQYLPNLGRFYGPQGIAPQGADLRALIAEGRWTNLLFPTGSTGAVAVLFGLWVIAAVALLVGYQTRVASVATWLGTLAFVNRTPFVKNHGDDVLLIVLLVLMLAPCAEALSFDARRRAAVPWIHPWPVRLLQLQLATIYFVTGLAKLRGHTWPDGTSVHYALNNLSYSRWSFAEFPVPFAATAALTWATLAFELGFPLLMLQPVVRRYTLWGGVLLHAGIWLTLEVGSFSFYMVALYGVWIGDAWWQRRRRSMPRSVAG